MLKVTIPEPVPLRGTETLSGEVTFKIVLLPF